MKIAKNYLYNVGYQFFSIALPIITIPYISRVLGAPGIGENEFSLSIVQLFVLLGMLGTLTYGNKEIGKYRDNKTETLANFFSIYINQFISCIVSLIVYFILINIYFENNLILYSVQAIYILSAAFDISWYYQGKEEFKKTVRRGIITKLFGVFLTFVFVKSESDVVLYAFILAISTFLGQILMWSYFVKEFSRKDLIKAKDLISGDKIVNHLRGSLLLFLPVIGMQVYSVIDRAILGFISGSIETGFYVNAVKIVRIPLYIVTSLGIVMLPRLSYEIGKGNFEKVDYFLKNSVQVMLFIAIPLTFGLIGISENFVPWFFGDEFDKVAVLIPILAFMIIPRTITNILGVQLLVPSGKIGSYTFSITMGAVSSVTLNIILTNILASIGAAIVSVIAESIVMICMLYFTKKYYKIFINMDLIKYLFSSIIMLFIVYITGYIKSPSIVITFLQMIFGISSYILCCIIMRCDIINIFRQKVRLILK
jgi:O-antigen/teichoic acid export membrane protein